MQRRKQRGGGESLKSFKGEKIGFPDIREGSILNLRYVGKRESSGALRERSTVERRTARE